VRRRKTLLFALALGLGLAAAAPAGALNPQSAGLQVALRFQGLYSGPIDALVGPRTVAAVRAFQRREGMRVTGRADIRTRVALGPLGRPLFGRRQLRRGMLGWDVAVLQFLLARQGYGVPVTGWFDRATARSLRTYQRRLSLAADGIAGARTFAALGLQTRVPVPAKVVRVSARVTPRRYVVKSGDTLTAIAARAGTTVAALAHLNGIDPAAVLLIGKRLRLPTATRAHAQTAVLASSEIEAVRESLDRWAGHYGIDPSLARALAWMESGFQQRVVSSVGAMGVMQLLPSTWDYVTRFLIRHPVAHTADGNIHVGLAYLRHLLNAFHGDKQLALAAWYQGERAVRVHGPYKESKVFVADVLALQTRI
jgi:soluble lytic murein transglycosylase-like protein